MKTRLFGAFAALVLVACGGVDASNDAAGGGDGGSDPDPTPMAVSPTSGPLAGGNEISISGMRLGADVVVIIGDLRATDVSVGTDGGITATVPPGLETGRVDVIVFDAHGYGELSDGYAYNAVPTITEVSPSQTTDGGTITITGSGFTSGEPGTNTVTLGGVPCADLVVVSDTEITCTAPAATTIEVAQIVISNRNGTVSTPFLFRGPGILLADGRAGITGALWAIDPNNPSPTAVRLFDLPAAFTGLTYTASGALFGTQSTHGSPASLYRFDPVTLVPTVVGPLMSGGSPETEMPDLTAIGEQLYAWSEQGDNLTTVDSATGAVVHDAATYRNSAGSGTVARPDGTILFMPGHNEEVAVVDLALHTNTVIGTLTGRNGRIDALTYHLGRLYGVMCPDGDGEGICLFIHIDEATWTITTLAEISGGVDSIASATPLAPVLPLPPVPRALSPRVPSPRTPALPTFRTVAFRGAKLRADRIESAPGAVRRPVGAPLAGRLVVPVGAKVTATSCRGKKVVATGELALTANQRGQWKLVDLATGSPFLRDVCEVK